MKAHGRPSGIVFLSHRDRNLLFRLPLMRRLVNHGVCVYAVAPEGSLAERFEKEGVEFVSCEMNRQSFSLATARRDVNDLASLLGELRPQLLHTFTLRANAYGALAARRAHIPIIISTVTGLGSLYVERAGLKHRILRLGVDRVTQYALKRVSAVVFQNPEDRAYYLSKGICLPDQARLIVSSGVDLNEFSRESVSEEQRVRLREDWSITTELPVITMVARLIDPKGIREFLQAAERLHDQAQFVLIGDTDPGNPTAISEDELLDYVRGGILIAPGRQENIPDWLSITDVYVLPSYYREGVPRSILEAMAMGLPIVTTDHPGCRETVVEGRNGMLVPPRSVGELQNALQQLIEDPELRRRMGAASLDLAVKTFNAETIVDQYLELYEALGFDRG